MIRAAHWPRITSGESASRKNGDCASSATPLHQRRKREEQPVVRRQRVRLAGISLRRAQPQFWVRLPLRLQKNRPRLLVQIDRAVENQLAVHVQSDIRRARLAECASSCIVRFTSDLSPRKIRCIRGSESDRFGALSATVFGSSTSTFCKNGGELGFSPHWFAWFNRRRGLFFCARQTNSPAGCSPDETPAR